MIPGLRGLNPEISRLNNVPLYLILPLKKNQLYLANVLNSNIVVEMPKEQSTFDLACASLAFSQPGNGVSWFCLTELGGLGPH